MWTVGSYIYSLHTTSYLRRWEIQPVILGRLNMSSKSSKSKKNLFVPYAGLLGLLAAPLLRNTDGVVTSTSDTITKALEGLGWNCVGAVVLIAYYFVVSSVLFLGLDKVSWSNGGLVEKTLDKNLPQVTFTGWKFSQYVFVIFLSIFVFSLLWPIFSRSNYVNIFFQAGLFRVDAKAEAAGLDIIKHKERAYDYGKIKTMKNFTCWSTRSQLHSEGGKFLFWSEFTHHGHRHQPTLTTMYQHRLPAFLKFWQLFPHPPPPLHISAQLFLVEGGGGGGHTRSLSLQERRPKRHPWVSRSWVLLLLLLLCTEI